MSDSEERWSLEKVIEETRKGLGVIVKSGV